MIGFHNGRTLASLYCFFILFLLALTPRNAVAEPRVGHSDDYLVVEIPRTDYYIPTRKVVFDATVAHFDKVLSSLRESGLLTDDLGQLSIEQLNIVNTAINEEIALYYHERFSQPSPVQLGPEGYPVPANMLSSVDDFSLATAAPTAYFLTFSVKFAKKRTEAEAKRIYENVGDAIKGSRSVGSALVQLLNGGAAFQVGAIANVQYAWMQPKNPESGLKPYLGFTIDVEPILIGYGQLGAGVEITNQGWASRFKPTFGVVWGDMQWAYEYAGMIYNASANFDWRLPDRWIPDGWNKHRLLRWIERGGFNSKFGCVNNPRIDRLLPACDFLFKSWRLEARNVDMSNRNFHWSFNFKGNGGLVFTGEPGLRVLLSLFQFSPETIDEIVNHRSIAWMLSRETTYYNGGELPPEIAARGLAYYQALMEETRREKNLAGARADTEGEVSEADAADEALVVEEPVTDAAVLQHRRINDFE